MDNIKTSYTETRTIRYDVIDNVDEVNMVIKKIGADFVIGAINRALRDRAIMNTRAGLPVDRLDK